MTLTLSKVLATLRQLASVASIVVGATNVGGLPASVRAVLVAVGGLVQAVEHYTAARAPAAPSAPVTTVTSSTGTASAG